MSNLQQNKEELLDLYCGGYIYKPIVINQVMDNNGNWSYCLYYQDEPGRLISYGLTEKEVDIVTGAIYNLFYHE